MADLGIQQLDLYYRHARYENMMIVGKEPQKTLWLDNQIRMFQRLGWTFVTVDLSGELERYDVVGEAWSDLERRAIQHIANPIIRVHGVLDLLSTLSELESLLQRGQLAHTIVIHFGRVQMTPSIQKSIVAVIRKLAAYRTGLWIVVSSLNTIPVELTAKLFHTHIILNAGKVGHVAFQQWVHALRVDLEGFGVEHRSQSVFVFNGRSEGAKGQILIGVMD